MYVRMHHTYKSEVADTYITYRISVVALMRNPLTYEQSQTRFEMVITSPRMHTYTTRFIDYACDKPEKKI